MDARNFDYKKALPFVAAGVFVLAAVAVLLVSGVPQPSSDEMAVQFALDAPDARSVSVVGDWNHWNPEADRLVRGDGLWRITLRLKKGDVYFYNFLIDGEKWITDPSQLAVSEDVFGKKSVLDLTKEGEP
jgi:1,4-alpha-glucan branching enzyme